MQSGLSPVESSCLHCFKLSKVQQHQWHCAETNMPCLTHCKQLLSRCSGPFLTDPGILMCSGTSEEEHQLVMPQMPNVHSSQAGLPLKYVVGFGKMVDVFSSKQRPKKLTIYGDDFRCVPLAVSGALLPVIGVLLSREVGKGRVWGGARGQKSCGDIGQGGCRRVCRAERGGGAGR